MQAVHTYMYMYMYICIPYSGLFSRGVYFVNFKLLSFEKLKFLARIMESHTHIATCIYLA